MLIKPVDVLKQEKDGKIMAIGVELWITGIKLTVTDILSKPFGAIRIETNSDVYKILEASLLDNGGVYLRVGTPYSLEDALGDLEEIQLCDNSWDEARNAKQRIAEILEKLVK